MHTHKSVNEVNMDPSYDLLPFQCQAITWTNTDLLSIGLLEKSEVLIKIHFFSRKCTGKWYVQIGGHFIQV